MLNFTFDSEDKETTANKNELEEDLSDNPAKGVRMSLPDKLFGRAKAHLAKLCLIENTRQFFKKITARCVELLKTNFKHLPVKGLDKNKGDEEVKTIENIGDDTATTESMEEVIINMVVESWRISRIFERLLTKLDERERNRYRHQLDWFEEKIKKNIEITGWSIPDLEGQVFDPGMAVIAKNIEDFDNNETLIIDQVVEPVIMGKNGLLSMGTVTLRRTMR